VTLYAESSAVLAWLFEQPRGDEARRILDGADMVVASRLTRLECLRAIVRVEAAGIAGAPDLARMRDALARTSAGWVFVEVGPDVLDRAAAPFPSESVRSLDAIHLATVLVVKSASPALEMVALDERVRRNARLLGVPVLPV
jgi:predicted nucleic acid-binding protein